MPFKFKFVIRSQTESYELQEKTKVLSMSTTLGISVYLYFFLIYYVFFFVVGF